MPLNTTKNRYKDSKHFLLIYYPLKVETWDCNNICSDNLKGFYIPIKTFDTLLQIDKYISYNLFVKVCFDAKIYCTQQLRVLIGIDSKVLKDSINKYVISNNTSKMYIDNYYFFVENILFLEEFVDKDKLDNIDRCIKLYNIRTIGSNNNNNNNN